MGAVAKSYMSKAFLIYEEMRKYFPHTVYEEPLVIFDFAVYQAGYCVYSSIYYTLYKD
jgi:hypothetical protein